MTMDKVMEGYKSLATSIVLQAYTDFSRCAKKLKKGKGNQEEQIKEMKEIVSFAESNWFCCLTDIRQEAFLKKLKEVVEGD